MSKIPYLPELTPSRNMERLRAHLGITNVALAEQNGLSPAVVRHAIERNFKTAAGNENKNTRAIKQIFSSYFTDGIPGFTDRTKADIYELMGCTKCEFRTKTHAGCIKFCLTKQDINNGPFITTLKHGSFTLSENHFCPHAPEQ